MHKPLVNFQIENAIADELHIMLSITYHLLENLFQEVKDIDDLAKVKAGLNTAELELPHGHQMCDSLKSSHNPHGGSHRSRKPRKSSYQHRRPRRVLH